MTELTRRTVLTIVTSSGLTGALGGSGPLSVRKASAQTQTPRTIGLAHVSRRDASSGEGASYAIMGAQLGAEEADTTAEMLGSKVELSVEETPNADRALAVARTLTAQGDFRAIIGHWMTLRQST